MAHVLPLMSCLFVFAAVVHASDVADRSMHQGFLSQYMGSDASKTSLGDYNKFAMHRFNQMMHAGASDVLSHHNGLAEHGPGIYDSQQVDANGRYGEIRASTMFDKQAPAAPAQDSMAFTSAGGCGSGADEDKET